MKGRSLAFALALSFVSACAPPTQYAPQLVARGELVLRYQDGFELWAGDERVATRYRWSGLEAYVRCVPAAQEHARSAHHDGVMAVVFSWLGGSLGVISAGGLVGAAADQDHLWTWLGAGVGTAAVGALFAGLSRALKNSANGHAVDAMNYYNDSVGSLGATCSDLRYPPPAAAAPPDVAPPPVENRP